MPVRRGGPGRRRFEVTLGVVGAVLCRCCWEHYWGGHEAGWEAWQALAGHPGLRGVDGSCLDPYEDAPYDGRPYGGSCLAGAEEADPRDVILGGG